MVVLFSTMEEIAKGAEAVIYLDNQKIIKDRIKKNYRLDFIDEKLRLQRTKSEAKILTVLGRAGLLVPNVISAEKNILNLEFIAGKKVRDILKPELCEQIGKTVRTMHSIDIIHGDLTTSNMLFHEGKIYFIDFGLGNFSKKIEDKAVDLHLFKECLVSAHNKIWMKCWNIFTKAYADKDVLARLEIVEKRGKYR